MSLLKKIIKVVKRSIFFEKNELTLLLLLHFFKKIKMFSGVPMICNHFISSRIKPCLKHQRIR